MKITFLLDKTNNWIEPYVENFINTYKSYKYERNMESNQQWTFEFYYPNGFLMPNQHELNIRVDEMDSAIAGAALKAIVILKDALR